MLSLSRGVSASPMPAATSTVREREGERQCAGRAALRRALSPPASVGDFGSGGLAPARAARVQGGPRSHQLRTSGPYYASLLLRLGAQPAPNARPPPPAPPAARGFLAPQVFSHAPFSPLLQSSTPRGRSALCVQANKKVIKKTQVRIWRALSNKERGQREWGANGGLPAGG